MTSDQYNEKSAAYLHKLCVGIADRSVGSPGNRSATEFFQQTAAGFGWSTELQEFDALDWVDGGACLHAGGEDFEVLVSPYSNGCKVTGRLTAVSSLAELEQADFREGILLLHGEIAKEQLMPKNFVFYNPEEHQHIISLLEKGAPQAIVSATARNPALAGGVYPFPLIEDGDIEIPSVYMTDLEGARLFKHAGTRVELESNSRRIPGKGWNVIASQGRQESRRIVVSAHIDAKKGTPGAIDNASGVVILLLLAEMLQDHQGETPIDLVALNGEDYYAAPGQMAYLASMQGRFDTLLLNINIDGAGYKEGKTAFSFYDLPDGIQSEITRVIQGFNGITQGVQWVQGDHSMFLQNGCPAIAISSCWFTENIDAQDVTHTPRDNISIVDASKLVEIARALELFIRISARSSKR